MEFSVLLSVYNKENPKYLAASLSSLAQQTLAATEVVMVVDGQIGVELKAVLNSYIDVLKMKIIYLPQNVGLGKALNEGLKHCVYEWVFRMDTDDICSPQRFEKQCKFIKNNQDITIIGTQISEFIDQENNVIRIRKVPIISKEIYQFAKKRNPFNHMTVAYKKSAILSVGGYQHHLYMEDYNLWLRLLAKGYIGANLTESLLLARIGNGMLMRRHGWQYVLSEWQLFRLKINLGFQNRIQGLITFLTRAGMRVMPIFLLKKAYQFLRR